MNTIHTPQNDRPLGYWLKAADRLMAAEFARAFESEGLNRRDWRLLTLVKGDRAALAPLDERKLLPLIHRGWVVRGGDGWVLTDAGQEAEQRLGAIVDGIRAKVADAVSDEDYATTVATLEKIARAYGWDENTELPRKPRHHRGGFRGFGRQRHDDGARRGAHAHPFGEHPFGEHPSADRPHSFEGRGQCPEGGHHGGPRESMHRRAAGFAQHAYERGFDAGFERGHASR